MPLDNFRISFAKVILGRLGAVFSSCASEGTTLKNSGIPEALPSGGPITPTLSVDPSLVPPQSASPNNFVDFLLINPHITDGNLLTDYYTEETMMSLKAKFEMVLPDKKPLPNFVVRYAIVKFMPLKYT